MPTIYQQILAVKESMRPHLFNSGILELVDFLFICETEEALTRLASFLIDYIHSWVDDAPMDIMEEAQEALDELFTLIATVKEKGM